MSNVQIGFKWVDTGFTHPVDMDTVRFVLPGSNGVCIAGGQDLAYLFRSTDYGVNWTNLGVQFAEQRLILVAYLGLNGSEKTWIAGTYPNGYMLRSVDDGLTWANIGAVVAGEDAAGAMISLGNGVAISSTSPNGHIIRSTDWGASWTDLGDLFSESRIGAFVRLSSTYILGGTIGSGKVIKSVDNGATWDNALGSIGEDNIQSLVFGKDNVLMGTTSDAANGGRMFRSTDLGATWTRVATQLGATETSVNNTSTDGLGNWAACTYPNGNIWHSFDNGVTWESRGRQFLQTDFFNTQFVGNSPSETDIFLGGTTVGGSGKILRSTTYIEGKL